MAGRDALCGELKPSHYDLDLYNINFDTWTYDGKVAVQASFGVPLRTIKLHAKHLKISTAQVLANDAVVAEATSFDYDEKAQLVAISLDREVPATPTATILLTFSGSINDDLSGFYRSQYKPAVPQAASVARDADGSHYIVSTHMEPDNARRAFPCFDLPYLKASFALSIEVPTDQVALNNMPVKETVASAREGWHIVKFETTPVMSTYLVAWAVGDFAYLETHTEREYENGRIPIRVYTVRGIEEEGEYALGVIPRAIDLYSELFDIPCPLTKVDIVVVPDMPMDSMENWGLITSQRSGMLFNKSQSNEAAKEQIADNICHELAHQWFGNLVTMAWWDELWLNEGFATWVGHYAVDRLFPDWNYWAEYAAVRMEDAYRLDGLRNSHPVHIPFKDGLQIHQIFDQISYGKGCAVIRMLVSYVGDEVFFKGVSKYLKNNLYGNATAGALWQALDEVSGKDVGALADSWLTCVGYPVLQIEEDVEKKEIKIKQSRFLISGDVKPEDDTTLWRLPLCIRGCASDSQNEFLTTKEARISGVDMDFYTVNSQGAGFYRVAYPPSRLAKLGKQLDRLTPEGKIAIIGSAAALVKTGASSVTSLLAFLQEFRYEKNVTVWMHVLGTLEDVSIVFSEDEQIRKGFRAFTRQLVDDKANELLASGPIEGDHSQKVLWRMVLTRAAICGHLGTVDRFSSDFTAWATRNAEIPAIKRRIAFNAALQKDPAGTNATLMGKIPSLPPSDPKIDMLQALPNTDSREQHDALAALNMSGGLRVGEMHTLLFALSRHPVGRHAQWAFIKAHWDAVVGAIGDPGLVHAMLGALFTGFSTEEVARDIDDFFKDKDTEGFKTALESAKEQIRAKVAYRTREEAALKAWLAEEKYI